MGNQQSLRRLARRCVRDGFYWLFAALGFAYRRLGLFSALSGSPRRILVIRLDLLGDVLLTMPLVEGLRSSYPSATITMLTLPYTAPLARLYPAVDEIVEVDTNRIRTMRGLVDHRTWREFGGTVRLLRSRRFDLAVSVHGRMSSLWAFLSGARRSVGYAGEAFPNLLSDPLPGGRHRERMHEVEYVRRLARYAGARSVPNHLALMIPPQAHDRMTGLLASCGIEPTDQLLLIHAGSVNGSAKRWPAGSWARFADIVQDQTAVAIVLVGAASDEPIAREVIARSSARLETVVGKTDIAELAALIKRADVVASGDSGPLHLSVALNRPLVAVYGPTDPVIYGPYNSSAPLHLHRRDLPCGPCYTLAASAECPLGDPICMRLVTVQQMARSAIALLRDPTDTAS